MRLGFVAGFGLIQRPLAPISGPARGPREGRVTETAVQRPAGILHVIGGETKLAAAFQDAGEFVEAVLLDQPAAMVAHLRPRVGKEHDDAIERSLGQTPEQEPDVVIEDTHVAEIVGLDAREQSRDAVDESLATDEANGGIGLGLVGQVFARAEADLKSDFTWLEGKKRGRIDCPRNAQGNAQPGQQVFGEFAPAGAQPASAAPAVEA